MPRPTLFTLSIASMLIATASPAYAYLDAGTGSMMLQAIVGAAASALMLGRLYFARIKALFVRDRNGDGK